MLYNVHSVRGLAGFGCILVLIWEVHTFLQGNWPQNKLNFSHRGVTFRRKRISSAFAFAVLGSVVLHLVWLNTWPCPSCSPPMSSYVLVLLFLSAFWFPLISCYGYHWLPFLRFLFSWLLSCRYVHRTSWSCCCFDWWRWSVPHARAIQYT